MHPTPHTREGYFYQHLITFIDILNLPYMLINHFTHFRLSSQRLFPSLQASV
jgi:hypothetical protein